MPNYEYRCERCGHEMEVWGAKVDDPPPLCQVCIARLLEVPMIRQVSLGVFRMIGGGWTRSNHNRWSYGGPKSST